MPRRKKSSDVEQMNMALIAVVLALILFGLGYVVGRAKTRLKSTEDFRMMSEDFRKFDTNDRERFIDQMMMGEDTRQMIFDATDDYRMDIEQ